MTSAFFSPAKLTALRATAGVLHGIALIMTCFRVTYRKRRGSLFWDDSFAVFAAIFDVIFFATIFLKIAETNRELRGSPLQGTESIASYMLQTVAYTSAVWCGRLSIAFSILRVLLPSPLRYVVIGTIVYFGSTWLTLIAVRVVICMQSDFAHHGGACVPGKPFIVTKLCHDVFANALLEIIPLFMMWRSRLPHVPRRMIRTIFALNILMTAFSVTHMIAQFKLNPLVEGFSAHYESAVTLMVCNLLVVATWVYRIFRNGEGLDLTTSDNATSRPSPEPTPLTFTNISSPGPSMSPSGYSSSRAASRTDTEKSMVEPLSAVHPSATPASAYGSRQAPPSQYLVEPLQKTAGFT